MKIATISWTFGLSKLDELFSTVKEIGYNALQFCGNFEQYPASEVKNVAEHYQIELIGYDPIDCKPETPLEATLENAVAYYKKVIDYAFVLDVPMATLQGLSFWTNPASVYKEAMQFIIDAVQQLCIYAHSKNIILTYEACNHYEVPWVHTLSELLQIHQAVQADNLKLVLDSFHMNINERDTIQALKTVPMDVLYSFHISDSGRGGIGTGHIHFQEIYQILLELGFEGSFCFEFVMPENRPYKLPMNAAQMETFIYQSKQSLQHWDHLTERAKQTNE